MAELIGDTMVRAILQVREFPPLQRIILTCPGTLQTTLAAYFGCADVRVEVLSQEEVDSYETNRSIDMLMRETILYHAESRITAIREDVRQLVRDKELGIGQILAKLGIRPGFRLLSVGRDSMYFWRTYKLEGEGIVYRITETFPRELYEDAT